MNKLKSYAASKRGRDTLLCFGIVIIAYIIVQAAIAGSGISSQIKRVCSCRSARMLSWRSRST